MQLKRSHIIVIFGCFPLLNYIGIYFTTNLCRLFICINVNDTLMPARTSKSELARQLFQLEVKIKNKKNQTH